MAPLLVSLKRQVTVLCKTLVAFTFMSLSNMYSNYILGKNKNLNLGIETIKNMFNSMLIDANKEATLMKSAPNGPVHVLEDPSKIRNILDYMKKDRLLVLNFGSST